MHLAINGSFGQSLTVESNLMQGPIVLLYVYLIWALTRNKSVKGLILRVHACVCARTLTLKYTII